MLKKSSEKLRAKFPATTPGCSMLKFAHLDDAFLEVFEPQASPVEGQSLQQKEKKGEKGKLKKSSQKSQNFGFCTCLSQTECSKEIICLN